MPKLKAVIFDLDDTLIERRAMLDAFSHKFLHHCFPDADGAEYAHIRDTFIQVDDGGYTTRPELFHQLYTALGKTDMPPATELLDFWNAHFADHTILVPGVKDTLCALQARGYLLGMITNGNPVLQNHKIDHTGFRKYFDNIIVSGTFGCDKPNPSIFRAALAALRVTANDAIYIGDNPVNDIYGAHRVGMKAVWANYFGRTNHTEYRPDYEIHALTELTALDFT
ncbi:MAG: HAD-IA family hydrolase [Ethanoligenens sp.]